MFGGGTVHMGVGVRMQWDLSDPEKGRRDELTEECVEGLQ